MKIGLFGGSFDCVHLGHLLLAEQCLENNKLDEIWFIPNATSPFKQDSPPISGVHRLRMLTLGIRDFDRENEFIVSNYEIQKGDVNYTCDTIKYYKELFPKYEFSLIVGEDINIDEWKNADYIKSNVNIITSNIVSDIRSSRIRQRIKEGRSIRFQVPLSVEHYIYEYELYK